MRGLIFDEIVAPSPPREPKEPIPDFTHIGHDDYTWCAYEKTKLYADWGKGHLYSRVGNLARRVEIWKHNQLHGDRTVSIEWVQKGTPCPHCAAEDHSKAEKRYKAEAADHANQVMLHEHYRDNTARPTRERGIDL